MKSDSFLLALVNRHFRASRSAQQTPPIPNRQIDPGPDIWIPEVELPVPGALFDLYYRGSIL